MFWGLIMEPGRCYTQKVKCSFHVSMAALDISNSGDDPVQVMCVFEDRNYLLCTLNKKDKVQCTLDLNFEAGTKVSFATNGKAHVHLTGYLITMQDDWLEDEEDEDYVPAIEKKRSKKEITDGPPSKKKKVVEAEVEDNDEDEDSNDSNEEESVEEENSDEEEDVEEEGEEEEEEEEDGDDDDEDDESSLSEEEIELKPGNIKQNGVSKSAPAQKKKNEEKISKEAIKKGEAKKDKQPKAKKTVLKGGVVVEDVKEGSGEVIKNGKVVHVYYEGRFVANNKLFDSTTKGPGFSFRVGKGEVIKGWDIGVVGMKVGGKRRITCPPKVAYGAEGSPPIIPPNSTLVFDVEVKKVS